MIKLVIFDGEGVTYNSEKTMKVFVKEYKKFLGKFNVDFKEQEKLWFKFYPKLLRGKIKLVEANTLVYEKLGIPKSYVRKWLRKDREIFLKHTKLYKNVKKLLKRLKEKGLKVAILSNAVHPLRWRIELFNRLGLVKGVHYDKIFLSNQIGFAKPEAGAYLYVLKYFRVKPERAVFVGHDKKEIEGAKRLGIRTLKVSRKINRKNIYTTFFQYFKDI